MSGRSRQRLSVTVAVESHAVSRSNPSASRAYAVRAWVEAAPDGAPMTGRWP